MLKYFIINCSMFCDRFSNDFSYFFRRYGQTTESADSGLVQDHQRTTLVAACSIAAKQGAVVTGLPLVHSVVSPIVRVPYADVTESKLCAHHGRHGPATHPVAAAGPSARATRPGLSAVQSQVSETSRQQRDRQGRADDRPGAAQAVNARSVTVLSDHRRRCGAVGPDRRAIHVAAVWLHGDQRTVAEAARQVQEPHIPGPQTYEAHQVGHQQVRVEP